MFECWIQSGEVIPGEIDERIKSRKEEEGGIKTKEVCMPVYILQNDCGN